MNKGRQFLHRIVPLIICGFTAIAGAVHADTYSFTTGTPDGRMATASRPSSTGKIEIESADDFLLSSETILNSGTFTGLITGASPTVGAVNVEIYRVFPFDSTNPPSGNVPTRTNSPSDVAFTAVGSVAGTLTFGTTVLSPVFSAANSVLNGINKIPNQTTGGEGPVTGQEVLFNFSVTGLLDLPAGHYFFVPQVEVTGGEFYWLSTQHTVPLFTGDLQEWIRNENLAPDWLRVGTDIVGSNSGQTFNAAFSLNGTIVPDAGSTMILLGFSFLVLEIVRRSRMPNYR
jgi:VPDSG-CTERM motif